MYEIFKNVLKGDYELVDMLNKIAEYYIKGNLSSGAHDCYNTGDKVKENDRYFVAIQDGIVWAPSVYPAAWNDVTEQVLAGESV